MATESQDTNPRDGAVKVIELKHPFIFGKDKQITECIFHRRTKAKDLKGLKLANGMVDDQCVLLGRITNLSTPEIEELDLEDFSSVGTVVADFLPDSLKGGKTS